MEEQSPKSSWSTPTAPDVPALAPTPVQKQEKPVPTQAPVYAGFLVGGVIAGVLLSTSWHDYKTGTALSAVGATTSSAAVVIAPTSTAATSASAAPALPFAVADQPAGKSVVVTDIDIAAPAWVVVYTSTNGTRGNALGARLVYSDTGRVSVGLLRNTTRGGAYLVGLSKDNGDQAFSLAKDTPVVDEQGRPVWATFRAR